jgi:putative ferrous iron transport protein C
MSLLDIKTYLMRVRITSLANLATYFNTNPDVLRGMLSHWLRKGCLRKCQKTAACGGSCFKCDPLITEIYEWVM